LKATLSAKQVSAIELLATGKEQKEVASLVGVDETTVYRWMKDADFRSLVHEKTKASVADYTPELLQTLLHLSRFAEKESVRYQSARELLYMAGWKPVEVVQQIGDTVIEVKIDGTDNTTD
jgi:transposase